MEDWQIVNITNSNILIRRFTDFNGPEQISNTYKLILHLIFILKNYFRFLFKLIFLLILNFIFEKLMIQ